MNVSRHVSRHLPNRLAAIASLSLPIVLLAMVWLAFIDPLLESRRETREKLLSGRNELQRAQAVAAFGKRTPDLGGAAGISAFKDDFLVGQDARLISAELQTLVRNVVSGVGGELNSTIELPEKTVQELAFIGSRFQIRASLQRMQQILHTLETSRPMLFIEKATLRVEGGVTNVQEPQLVSEIDVYGARLPELPRMETRR